MRLKKYQKNAKKGDKVICQYCCDGGKIFYGDLFDAEIIESGCDNYSPKRDLTVKKNDESLVTLWRYEIKGIIC